MGKGVRSGLLCFFIKAAETDTISIALHPEGM